MLNSTNDLKLYYSIGEVSQMCGITETTLRYWEREIPQLKPKKAGRNIRQYTKEDLEIVRLCQCSIVYSRSMSDLFSIC